MHDRYSHGRQDFASASKPTIGDAQLAPLILDARLRPPALLGEGSERIFAIPGLAGIADVEVVGEACLVRVTFDPDRFTDGLKIINVVRWGTCRVFVKLMKPYALSADEMGSRVQTLSDAGMAGAYLVDNSGGMLPQMIVDTAVSMRISADFPLGFLVTTTSNWLQPTH